MLVVDDHEINRNILEAILEEEYALYFAANGQEAMACMRAHTQELSLVLLDLIMPVMTGFEVLGAVREDEVLRNIPIIVLTAEKSAELTALQLGAADFITKPFEIAEVVLARVARIIELCEGRQLISAAEHDPLTGLYSRNFFYEYAQRICQYHPERAYDAVVLNIEQFHSVNSVSGREFGDHVLHCLGEEIREVLRGTGGIAGRYEADVFDIFCNCGSDYRLLLDRLQKLLNEHLPNVDVRLRMGVCPYQKNREAVFLFDCARAACGMARGDSQNPIRVYNEEIWKQERLDRQLLNDLRKAVKKRQFEVYYQPKYAIQCDPPRLASAEALIRWQHPDLGMISPGVFVPLFEKNGLIGLADAYVWEEAAVQIARWKEKFGVTIPVSVNLSRTNIQDPDMEEKLVRLVTENGLSFADIKLEVTESAYTDSVRQMMEKIAHLRELGFVIEMDDFGSGYSSLNMLSEMPFDVLKMDMQFIRNIETNETDRRLVMLILDIARCLKVPVVVEGVETEGQLAILKEGGCDLVQGYYFSRPLPAGEFEELLKRELVTT